MDERGEAPKNFAPVKQLLQVKVIEASSDEHKEMEIVLSGIIFNKNISEDVKNEGIDNVYKHYFGAEFADGKASIETIMAEKEKPGMDKDQKKAIEKNIDVLAETIIDRWSIGTNLEELDAVGLGGEKDIKARLHERLYGLEKIISLKLIENKELIDKRNKFEEALGKVSRKLSPMFTEKMLKEQREKQDIVYSAFLDDLIEISERTGISDNDLAEVVAMGATISEKLDRLRGDNKRKNNNTEDDDASEKTNGKEIDYTKQYQEYVERNKELLDECYENYLQKCKERGVPDEDIMSFSDLNRLRMPDSYEEYVDKAKKIASLGKDLDKNKEHVEDYFISKDTYGHEYLIPRDKRDQLSIVREVMTLFISNDDTRSISNSSPFGFLDMVRRKGSLFEKDVRDEVDAFLSLERLGYYMRFANGLIGGSKNRQAIDAQFEDLVKGMDQAKLKEFAFLFEKGANGIPFSEMWNILETNGFSMNFQDKIKEGYKKKINIKDPSQQYREGYHGTLRKLADKDNQESKDFRNYLIAEKQELLQDILDAKSYNKSLGLNTIYDVIDKWMLADAGSMDDPQSDFQKTDLTNKRYLDKENGQRTNYFFDANYGRKELMTEYFKWKVAREVLKKQSFRELYGDLSDKKLSIEDQKKKAIQLSEMAFTHAINMLWGTGEMSVFNTVFGMHDDYREALALQSNFVDRGDKGKWCGPPIWKEKLYSGGTTFVRALAEKEVIDVKTGKKIKTGMSIYDGAVMAEQVKVYEKMQPEQAKINLYFWYGALLGKKITKFLDMIYKEDWQPRDLNSKFMRDLIDTCRKITDYNTPKETYEGEPAAVYGKNGKETFDSKLARSEGLRKIIFEGIIHMMANGIGLWGMSDIGMGMKEILVWAKTNANEFDKVEVVDDDGNPVKKNGEQVYRQINFISMRQAMDIYLKYHGLMGRSEFFRNSNKNRSPG